MNKRDIEKIIGRELLDFEYEFIAKCITATRKGKKVRICYGRHNGRTRLRNEITILDGILPQQVIFDEFIERK